MRDDLVVMRIEVHIGESPVDVTQIRFRTALNEFGTATLQLANPVEHPADLTAPILIERVGPARTPVMTVHAVRAEIEGDALAISAEGAAQLTGSTVRGFWAEGVDPGEKVHALARQVGFPEERLNIEGLDARPEAEYAIEALIQGFPIESPAMIGDVLFRPVGGSGVSIAGFDPIMDGVRGWGFRPNAVAKVFVRAIRMYDAETEGLDRIRQALDSVLAAATYGFTRLPWGGACPYSRDQIRLRPTLVPCVLVSESAQRRWLHGLGSDLVGTDMEIDDLISTWMPVLSGGVPVALIQCLRALRDATLPGRDPAARCQSLFDALEYYTARTKPPKLVERASVRAAIEAVNQLELPYRERSRLTKVLSDANQAPLMAKVRYQATLDGTIVSEPEWDLLARLREARNDAAHGRKAVTPEQHDLEWGASVVSRLIMDSWAAASRDLTA